MSQHDDKRRRLLGRLSQQLAYTAPVLALMAGGAALHATTINASTDSGYGPVSEETLLLASNHAQGEAEAEAEGEAEAEAEGEAEAEAEGEAEAEAEGEAEAGDRSAVERPEGYTPGYSEDGENDPALLALGEELFNDPSLSGTGMSCATCHAGDTGYLETFEQPYPHRVAMGENLYGMDLVHADEMVQMCMVNPMAAEALGWESEELAALSAYVVEVQRRYAGEPHNL